MADVKFTPGPWEWSEDRIWGGYSGLVGANGQEVLFPNTANDGDDGAAWFEDFPSNADAHLIAASPDLYEADKALAGVASRLAMFVHMSIPDLSSDYDKARAAELCEIARDALRESGKARAKAEAQS